VDGDSIFGQLTVLAQVPVTFAVRGNFSAPHVDLRVERRGVPEARITGTLDRGYIVAKQAGNVGYDTPPMIRFGRSRN
jgi:hypothetical protein